MASSCNCPITLKERKKKQTNNKQTNKQKQNHLRNSVFFTTWMLFNVRDKLDKAQSLKFFFFSTQKLSPWYRCKKRAFTFVMLLPCVVFRTERAEINHLQSSILSFN